MNLLSINLVCLRWIGKITRRNAFFCPATQGPLRGRSRGSRGPLVAVVFRAKVFSFRRRDAYVENGVKIAVYRLHS